MNGNVDIETKQMLARLCGLDLEEINDDDELVKDLGIDSLKIIEIATELEKKYKIVVKDEQIEKIKTVSDTVMVVKQLL